MSNESASTEAVLLDVELPHAPDKVWRAITEADLVGQWLMAIDLCPQVGSRFRLPPDDENPAAPMIDCEVIEVVPNQKLQWRQLERESEQDTRSVESIVTLQLLPTSYGTRLRIVHDRFRHVRLGINVVSLADRQARRSSHTPKITCAFQILRRAA